MNAQGPSGNTYNKYASKNPIERRLMDGFLRRFDSLLPAAAPNRILEVGIGEGELATRIKARFPKAEFVGVDLPDETLRAEWQRNGANAFFADAECLPFPDNSFDLVLGIEMLEHVHNPGRVLQEMTRVGTGSFVLSVPLEPWWRAANMARGAYLRDFGNTPGHINHWSHHRFKTLVNSHLRVTKSTIAFPWSLVNATLR